jgi:hypothetical protein
LLRPCGRCPSGLAVPRHSFLAPETLKLRPLQRAWWRIKAACRRRWSAEPCHTASTLTARSSGTLDVSTTPAYSLSTGQGLKAQAGAAARRNQIHAQCSTILIHVFFVLVRRHTPVANRMVERQARAARGRGRTPSKEGRGQIQRPGSPQKRYIRAGAPSTARRVHPAFQRWPTEQVGLSNDRSKTRRKHNNMDPSTHSWTGLKTGADARCETYTRPGL